jgi:hypothetical protein
MPRSELDRAAARGAGTRVGVYFLVGKTEDEVLVEAEGGLVFVEDHAFNTPSGAAGVVLGRSSDGWREWVDPEGRTLDERERQ